jgi:alkylation response protein AidB-like acyl-CoA dehydrogenase
LTEQQSLFAETATRLAADHSGPKRLRALRAGGAEIDAQARRAAAKAEWLATVVAERHGGRGSGCSSFALALEQAGRQLMLVPLLEAAATASTMSRAEDGSRAGAAPPICCAVRPGSCRRPGASWRYGGRSAQSAMTTEQACLDGSIAFVAMAGRRMRFWLQSIRAQPVLAVVPRADVSVTSESNVDGSTSSRS